MKIATLQFSPRVGEVARNFSLAESLLMRSERDSTTLSNLDILILPELAFTGYNFPSADAIAPFLEPTAAGPSTRWASRTARRLKCTVVVGYAEAGSGGSASGSVGKGKGKGAEGERMERENGEQEDRSGVEDGQKEEEEEEEEEEEHRGNFNTIFDDKIRSSSATTTNGTKIKRIPKAYNSVVVVDATGDVVAHYRKSHLYYTDETWASEGGPGFYAGVLPLGSCGRKTTAALGICMDINPYKFEAEWSEYEFAEHVRRRKVRLVVVSMAWLTRLSADEVFGDQEGEQCRNKPDVDTLTYWIERFRPLFGEGGLEKECVIVCANRTGEEGVAERVGEVRYAGSSCVMGFTGGKKGGGEGRVRIWDVMGRAQEGLMVVDTEQDARYKVVTKREVARGSVDDVPSTVQSDGLGTMLGENVDKRLGEKEGVGEEPNGMDSSR